MYGLLLMRHIAGGERVFVYRQTAARVEVVVYSQSDFKLKLISSNLMPTNGHSPDPSLLPRQPQRGRRHGGSARTRLPPLLGHLDLLPALFTGL